MIATRVSIVTPAYNAARVIADAVASVRRQAYDDWEMLIVDDCSKDDTREVVARLAAEEARIRLIPQAQNGGPARARQAALDAATGRYIAFLDSDDYWLPEKLERQLRFMAETGAVLTYTEFRRISADGSREGRRVCVPAQLTYSDLLKNTAIATSTVIIDKAKAGPFAMTETFYDDYALWLSILRRGHTAHGLKEDLMRYRVGAGSWSRNKLRSALWVWRTYRNVERLGVPRAAWCFAHYAWRAVFKYSAF